MAQGTLGHNLKSIHYEIYLNSDVCQLYLN